MPLNRLFKHRYERNFSDLPYAPLSVHMLVVTLYVIIKASESFNVNPTHDITGYINSEFKL